MKTAYLDRRRHSADEELEFSDDNETEFPGSDMRYPDDVSGYPDDDAGPGDEDDEDYAGNGSEEPGEGEEFFDGDSEDSDK